MAVVIKQDGEIRTGIIPSKNDKVTVFVAAQDHGWHFLNCVSLENVEIANPGPPDMNSNLAP